MKFTENSMFAEKLKRYFKREFVLKQSKVLPEYRESCKKWNKINDKWAVYTGEKPGKINMGYTWRGRNIETGEKVLI